ncbi:MAG: hypothetical protein MJZ13_08620 [Bacteroidales bacterium]|nr:hypothetical protein [Bacteroidales bacterium]
MYEITWTVGAATAINTINAPAKANIIKTIENGKVVIIRDGVKYDLSGSVIK